MKVKGMTDIERALFQIQHWNIHISAEENVLQTINDALEKQIPYTPKDYKGTAWNGVGVCKCGVIFLDRTTNYCGNCGQRLDWRYEYDR